MALLNDELLHQKSKKLANYLAQDTPDLIPITKVAVETGMMEAIAFYEKNINMKAITPQELKLSYDQQKVNEIVDKFNKKLLKEEYKEFYHVIIEGEYNRIILTRVEEEFKKAGWKNVQCITSSENGERYGLTGLKILR